MPPAPGTLKHGADFRPALVRHSDGRAWTVREVLSEWTCPGTPGERLAMPGVVRRWRLRVYGPVPGGSGERGEFVLLAEKLGNRPGWLLSAEHAAAVAGPRHVRM